VTTTSPDSGRRSALDLHWHPEDRTLVNRTARASGQTRTDFILSAARAQATEVLLYQVYVQLEPDAFETFAVQLDQPPEPNRQLRKTVAAYGPWKTM
jgi:uncharacterized protein (DUF1778 family)